MLGTQLVVIKLVVTYHIKNFNLQYKHDKVKINKNFEMGELFLKINNISYIIKSYKKGVESNFKGITSFYM